MKAPIPMPNRAGWLCEPSPSGGFHGWPAESRPSIQMNHIDGPVLYFRNGEIQWLTLFERFMVWVGRADAFSLERKHRPHLQNYPEPGAVVMNRKWGDGWMG